ncbi:MAG TPA: VWA domain-containing protein [Pyrinomonadaceae bacterium]|nr:VWA domain-containing protein [Pyrinomonadaceae bacterium]
MSGRSLSLDARGARAVRLLVALSLTLCGAPRVRSQETPKQQEKEEVVTVKSTLVNVDVTVKDKSGKYVTDLAPEDFTVYENGVRQKVEFFDPPFGGSVDAGAAIASSATPARAPAGQARNVISIVLDSQTTEQQNLRHLREGTLKYIRERIAETDAVAVFSVAAGLQLLQPFTHDKAKLTAAVENAFNSAAASKTPERNAVAAEVGGRQSELAGLQAAGARDTSDGTDTGAIGARLQAMVAQRALEHFTELRAQLSLQQSRPVLASLAALCEAQRDVPGKKTVVLFSQGFITSSTQDWQVQSIIDLANRANVAIYIIDAAGLRGGAPETGSYIPPVLMGNVGALRSTEERMNAQAGENVFDNVKHEGREREFDILYRISGDTGGKFIKGTNDIARGLERVDDEVRSRYTIGYHSTDANFNGDFRKLKVEVQRPGAEVSTRPGFYAIAHNNTVFFSPEDRKLLAGLDAAASSPSIPLFMGLSAFRAANGGYVIPLSIEFSPSSLKSEQKGGKRQMQFDVLGRIRGAGDERAVSRLGGYFQIALDERQYQAMLSDKLFLRQDLELAPGDYEVDLIVRDRLSGKLAAKREKLSLPESGGEFAWSGVVLSRHVDAAGPPAEGAADVLSHAGAAIRPTPSREFKAADNLIIFFRLYNASAAATGKPLVKVTVRLLADGKDAVKPIGYELTETTPAPVPHLAFAKFVSLAPLRPGKYTLSVEAKDTATGKLLRREEPFVVVQ